MKFILIFLTLTRQKFIKVLILFFSDIFFIFGPKRLSQIDCLPININRKIDKIGVFINDLFDLSLFNKFFMILFDMQNYFCSSCEWIIFNLWNLKLSWTIRRPFMSRLAFDSRNNFNQIRYDKRRIESNTELTDNIFFDFSTSFCSQWLHKLFRTTLCDCS